VQRSIPFDTPSIHVGALFDKVPRDLPVALVASDHEVRVAVSVGDLQVGAVVQEVHDDVQVSVEAGGSQGRGVGLGGAVDVGAVAHQEDDDGQGPGRGGAPQRRHVLDGLRVQRNCAALLDVGFAFLDEVLDDVHVAVSARQQEQGAAVRGG